MTPQQPENIIPARIIAFDNASETGTTQTDEFNLILENPCLNDKMTVTEGIVDYVYYLNEDTTSPDFPN